jgi:hypothetical protein
MCRCRQLKLPTLWSWATAPTIRSLWRSSPGKSAKQMASSCCDLACWTTIRDTKVTLTLDIDAETADGFPEDAESVLRDNAASLWITDFDFVGE